MSYALDKANVGQGSGDAAGTSPTVQLTTGQAVAAGARLFVAAAMNCGGSALSAPAISGGGLTWVVAGSREEPNSSTFGVLFYADCPSGLASGTTLSVDVTGNFYDWELVASSYTGARWNAVAAVDANDVSSGTAWASDSVAVPADSLLISAVAFRAPNSTPSSSSPTSPAVEDNEVEHHTTNTHLAALTRRIESTAGTVSVAGTFSQSTDGATVITAVFTEQVFPTSGTPASTNISTAADPHTVNLPAGLAAGDYVLALGRVPASSAITMPTGWTKLKDGFQSGTSSDRYVVAYKYLVAGDAEIGASTMSVDVDATTARLGAWLTWRVIGATPPATQAPQISADTTGASATPDPTTLTPTGGAKNYLWFWLGGWEGEQTSPPAGNPTDFGLYKGGGDSGTGGSVATNARVAGAARLFNGSSLNPGSWTISVTDDWIAWTLAFHPAAAAGASGSSSVSGGGAASGAGAKAAAAASTVRGGGAATGTARKAALAASTVRGGGSVVSVGAKGVEAHSGASSVRGGGSASSSVKKGAVAASTVRGGGAAVTATRKTASSASTVRGGGTVTGTTAAGRSSSSSVRGGGAVVTVVRKSGQSVSTVRGGGFVFSVGTQLQARSGTSTVRGGGSVASVGAAARASSSTVRGGGSASSTGRKAATTTSTVRGGGSVTSTGTQQVAKTGTSSVRGGGTVSGTGRKATSSTSTVRGGGSIAGTGRKSATTTSTVRGGGFVTSTGSQQIVKSGTSSVRGGGRPTSSGTKAAASSSTARGGGFVTSAARKASAATSAVRGGGSVTSTARKSASSSSRVTGGGYVTSTTVSGQAAQPPLTWRTGNGSGMTGRTAAIGGNGRTAADDGKTGRTTTRADEGRTLAGMSAGRSSTILTDGGD